MKTLFYFLLIPLLTNCEKNIYIDKSNCSSNSEMARKIAEKEWLKLYGENIYKKKPFNVSLKSDSIWIVEGTLPSGYDGGVPYAEINAKNCEILKIKHGK